VVAVATAPSDTPDYHVESHWARAGSVLKKFERELRGSSDVGSKLQGDYRV